MEILSVSTFLAGGTIRITVKNDDESYDQSIYCIDRRIGTGTRDMFYYGYPDENNIILDMTLVWELLTLLTEYNNGEFQSLANELSGGGEPFDKLKAHSIRKSINYRTL